MNKKIKISNIQANQRIDKFLASFYAEKSRASWQKGIRNKEILVNNKIIKPDYVLKENDKIKIFKISSTLSDFSPEFTPHNDAGARNDNFRAVPDIEIIYEDDDVIVLNKPAGVLSQNAESSKSPSISDFLVKHYPEIRNVGKDEGRFGVAHRLDKDTSGVIITAKNNQAFEFLKDQFKNRKTEKIYIALVYGKIKPKEGEINFKIGRSKANPNMQTAIDTKKKEDIKAREARTIYKTIEKFKDYSLLEVSPKTGRMHQIRVHLKAIGYPIVGDQKYFFKKHKNKDLELHRQFLHAEELKITLPNRKKAKFKAKLPNDLKNFLDKVKLESIG